jgi:hypothetical protein
MPPIAHSRYAQSCKLAFALADGIVKHKPIEEKDYWEEEGEFKGVKEHQFTLTIPKNLYHGRDQSYS